MCLFFRPLVLVGHWCWLGWGLRWWPCPSWTLLCGRWISGGYSATATRESCAGLGGLMCLWVFHPQCPLEICAFQKERGHGKGCFSIQLFKPHFTHSEICLQCRQSAWYVLHFIPWFWVEPFTVDLTTTTSPPTVPFHTSFSTEKGTDTKNPYSAASKQAKMKKKTTTPILNICAL